MKNNWPVKKLGEVAVIQSGGTPSRSKLEYWNGDIPWVKISDMLQDPIISTEEKITQIGLNSSSAKLWEKGTILLSIFATLGRVSELQIEAAANQAIAGINPTKAIDQQFLKFFLLTKANEILKKGRGLAQNNINLSILKEIEILLPPNEIQKKIVKRLDSIRKAQELIDLQIQKTEELYNSLLEKEIIAGNYGQVKLSDVTTPQVIIDPRKNPNEEYHYVDISAIDSENHIVNLDAVKQFKGKDAPSRARKQFSEGDILFSTVRPNLQHIAIVGVPVYNSLASTGFTVLSPDDSKINSQYMGTVTCSEIVTNQMLPLVRGAAYPAVSDRDVLNAVIPLPERKKQDEIAEKFNAIKEYKILLQRQKQLYKELFDSVLAKSMKGEVN
jgi:type I restriction enzyme S subunit